MAGLTLALLVSFAFLTVSVGAQLWLFRRRHARLKGLELRPNCLLTRHPIVFLSGPRSVFRLFSHWNEVPSYLREHGYEVIIIDPVAKHRLSSVVAALAELRGKCHLIADSSSRDLLESLAATRHEKVASLTWVRNGALSPAETSRALTAAALKPSGFAIELFDVSALAYEVRLRSTVAWLSCAFLTMHNTLSLFRARRVDGLETAAFSEGQTWLIEARFLDHAISLAERDAQWCD